MRPLSASTLKCGNSIGLYPSQPIFDLGAIEIFAYKLDSRNHFLGPKFNLENRTKFFAALTLFFLSMTLRSSWAIAELSPEQTDLIKQIPVVVQAPQNGEDSNSNNGSELVRRYGRVWQMSVSQGPTGEITSRLIPVPGLMDVSLLKRGMDYSHRVSIYSLKDDGTIWAWGDNHYGQLGDGTTTNRSTPVQVLGISNVTDIVTGRGQCYALRKDGSVWAWGNNNRSQLGDGTTTNRSTPVQVPGLSNIVGIASSLGASYAIQEDGTVLGWGDNHYGQLGEEAGDWANPAPVVGLTKVLSIATTSFGSRYALTSDGKVWAWGANPNSWYGSDSGEDGVKTRGSTPVPVPGLTDIVAISGGYDSIYALKGDGTVWAWGNNRYGQLGDGTHASKSPPVQISTLKNIKAIATGYYSAYALQSDGSLWAWGFNGNGLLHGGKVGEDVYTPIRVSSSSKRSFSKEGSLLR